MTGTLGRHSALCMDPIGLGSGRIAPLQTLLETFVRRCTFAVAVSTAAVLPEQNLPSIVLLERFGSRLARPRILGMMSFWLNVWGAVSGANTEGII